LFKEAILGETREDRNDNEGIKGIHRFYVPMEYDGRTFGVKMTVKEFTQPNQGNKTRIVK
jgi:hypothetical protein